MVVSIWKMVLQDFARELRYLATCNICPAYPFGSQIEAAYPAKQADVEHIYSVSFTDALSASILMLIA